MWNNSGSDSTLYQILTEGVGVGEGSGSGQILTKITAGTYCLLAGEDRDNQTSTQNQISDTARLSALITTVSLKKQTINNNSTPTNFSGGDWSYCTWTTAASDFKSRKFRCTGTKYNEETGYIERLSFEEISNK